MLQQLLKDEQQIFCLGVPILIVADVVHASFNISEMDETRRAILGPCAGGQGYEVVDVACEPLGRICVASSRPPTNRFLQI